MRALNTPSVTQQRREAAAPRNSLSRKVSRIPETTKINTAEKLNARSKRGATDCVKTGRRPRTMPPANAAAIAKAGSFTECALALLESRCETFVGIDRRDAFR